MRKWMHAGFVLALLPAGCSGPAQSIEPERALPFTVRLKVVDLPEPTAEEREKASTPADFGDAGEFTRKLRSAIEETGLFTSVLLEGEADAFADLDLEIKVNDHDFGPGQATFGGAVYSTLAWLFGGPASWVIDDREYPESRVSMTVTLREVAPDGGVGAERRPEEELFQDELRVDGLRSSFLERGDMSDWLLNVLLPPSVGDGEAEKAGASLAARCARFFVEHEPPRILSSFPADYVRITGCFLSYKPDDDELVIVSRDVLTSVTIRGEHATQQSLEQEVLLGRYMAAERGEEAVRRWLRERVVGLGSGPADTYFVIPLEELGFGGEEQLIRVEALLGEVSPTPVRWTIWREAAGEGKPPAAPSLGAP